MEKLVYKADTRGSADHGWLKTNFTFSFADYHDPERIHFGVLRVFNDDTIAGGKGFGMHPHDNMEIVTIPLHGEVKHRDSEGNSGVIKPGEIQMMSAGSGLMHSEFNNSDTEDVSLLQIWLYPKVKNIKPAYNQMSYFENLKKNEFNTVISPDDPDKTVENTMKMNQDAYFSLGAFDKGTETTYKIQNKGNGAFVFIVNGDIKIDGETYNKRDSIGITGNEEVKMNIESDSHVLIIDLPMTVK